MPRYFGFASSDCGAILSEKLLSTGNGGCMSTLHNRGLRIVCVYAIVAGLSGLMTSCGGGSGDGVVDTVLQDFGIRDRPDGYVSGSDKVFDRLGDMGKSELARLNSGGRLGDILYAEDNASATGRFFKEVKVYEKFYPLEAQSASRNSSGKRGGYVGYIEFSYRVYKSSRANNRTEAAAKIASIPTDERGRETYRYRFGRGGTWNGAKGELVKR